MTFPALSNEFPLQRLQFPTKKCAWCWTRIPITKSMTSLPWCTRCSAPKKLNVEAVYAAPFTNDRSTGPATGWRRAMKKSCACWNGCTWTRRDLYRGSTDYLSRGKPPQRSAAVDDLIRRAVAAPDDDPLLCSGNRSDYQCSGGPAARTGSGPQDRGGMAGGNTHHQPSTMEFNLMIRMPPGSFSTAACRSSRFLAWAWLRTF